MKAIPLRIKKKIGDCCYNIILEKNVVKSSYLVEEIQKLFPEYANDITPQFIGMSLSVYHQNNRINRKRVKKTNNEGITYYSVPRFKIKTREPPTCLICGRRANLGRFCYQCEKEAIKITESCYPLPFAADYPDVVNRNSNALHHYRKYMEKNGEIPYGSIVKHLGHAGKSTTRMEIIEYNNKVYSVPKQVLNRLYKSQ